MRNRKSNTSTKPSTSPARRRRAPTKPSSSRSLRLSREAQRQLLVVEALRRQTLRLFYRLHSLQMHLEGGGPTVSQEWLELVHKSVVESVMTYLGR